MRTRTIAAVAVLFTGLMISGCSSNMSSNTPPVQGQIPVSMTMRDTPPAGVTVLAFEVHVTGATLQPADTSKADVSLVSGNLEIELRHLETESALLRTSGAPSGTYNSLTLTFANPEMTIQNGTAATITVGGKSCAVGAICQFQPALNQATVKISASPFPLMLSSGTALSLDIDFDVDASLQNDLSVTPTVSVTPTISRARGEMAEADDLAGQVTAVGMNQFTLQPLFGPALTILVDNNTRFEDFDDAGCAANNFTCVQMNQIVSVDLGVMDDNDESSTSNASLSLTAKKVELKDHFQKELEGKVASVNAASGQFQLVVHDEAEALQGVALGDVLTITVNTGATFDVDQDGLTVPSGLQFLSISDMIAGQSVEINPAGITVSGSGIAVTTDRVRLHRTQVTGSVMSVTGANFTLGNLSSLFTGAGVTAIQVQTSSQTQFADVSGVASLTTNDTVSVGGLLFNSTPAPVLLAEKVRKH
ncbi:MAG TPA: DUF4382 domain-containing protein [Candidatus Acidoferrales bacterium]|nr:DUF4382 domain-containing protein [Candidatus Acidoferrales bacterium]